MTLTGIYATQLATALAGGVDTAELAQQWEADHPPDTQQQPQQPDDADEAAAASFLAGTATTAALTSAITPALGSLWAEGWFLGQASAESLVTGSPPDWRGWTPGDADAARKAATRDLDGFTGDQQGTVRGIVSTVVDRMARVLAEAKAQHQVRKDLAASLNRTLSDRQQAAVAAHHEAYRSQFGAAGLVFRRNHISSVDVVTDGDTKVCPACEALASANPHPIPAAGLTDLLPVHPNCRCVPVPAAGAPAAEAMADLLRHVLSDGYVPAAIGRD